MARSTPTTTAVASPSGVAAAARWSRSRPFAPSMGSTTPSPPPS